MAIRPGFKILYSFLSSVVRSIIDTSRGKTEQIKELLVVYVCSFLHIVKAFNKAPFSEELNGMFGFYTPIIP